MAFKHPHTYGFMLMVHESDYSKLDRYRKKLDPLVKFYMKPAFFDNIAPQHISLCYFSYQDKYPSKTIKKLIPKALPIIKKYIPLKLKAQGLQGGWELDLGVPAILWNITDNGKLGQFHTEIVDLFKKDIPHLAEADFTPHIGIALGDQAQLPKLKEFVSTTKKDPPITITLDRVFIYYQEGPEQIF